MLRQASTRCTGAGSDYPKSYATFLQLNGSTLSAAERTLERHLGSELADAAAEGAVRSLAVSSMKRLRTPPAVSAAVISRCLHVLRPPPAVRPMFWHVSPPRPTCGQPAPPGRAMQSLPR
jgi:hypothetical protein